MFKKDLTEIVKDLRKNANVFQEDLANYIWISRLTYINIENWKREFKEEEIKRIADLFEKPMSFFMEEKSEINKNDKDYKLKQLILYIINKTKDIPTFWKSVLSKILYFCDFNYYEWYNKTITDTKYRKFPYGPVPENITETLEEMVRDWYINITENVYHKNVLQKISPIKEVDMSLLDDLDSKLRYNEDLPSAIEIIDNVLNKFAYHKASEINKWVCFDKPYILTEKIWDVINPEFVFRRDEEFMVNRR